MGIDSPEKPLFTPPTRQEIAESVEKFSEEVGRYRQTSGLVLCNRLSSQMFAEGTAHLIKRGSLVSMWFLTYLAKELLQCSSDTFGIKDLTYEDAKRLARFYTERILDSVLDTPKDEGWRGLTSWTIKANYEQLVWQLPIRNLLVRTFYMMFDHPWEHYRKEQQRFSTLFEKIYGMSCETFLRIAIGLFVAFQKAPALNPQALIDIDIPIMAEACTEENVRKILDRLCIRHNEFRDAQRPFIHKESWERKYELNYLRKKPLIITSEEHIVAPIPLLIVDKMTNGIYYDMMDHCSDNNEDFERYTTPLGKLFHGYVGLLLSQVYALGVSLFDADDYFSDRRGFSTCDWIVMEGKKVILIECKNARLDLRAISSGDVDQFRDFLVTRYLNGGKLQFQQSYDDFVDKGYDVCCLIVYNDTIALYNAYRHYLHDQPSLIEKLERLHVQFMTIGELESLVPTLEKTSFYRIISSKLDHPDARGYRFDQFFSEVPEYSPDKELKLVDNVWCYLLGDIFLDATSTRN